MHATSAPAIDLESLRFVGNGLSRPECVLATARGDLFTADWRGGVAHLRVDGTQALYVSRLPGGRLPRPNGIALRADGSFLLADLGESLGGVFVLERSGDVRPLLEQVDGIDLPPTNFVHDDGSGRIWITVSTRHRPRAAAYRRDVADGFIVLLDGRGARIVADSLGYTNEAAIGPDRRWLYVNETFSRRLTRFRIGDDGSLSSRQTVTEFGAGTFPDGLAFDVDGGIWITSIVSNRVIRVDRDGGQQLMLEDCDPGHLESCEAAFAAGSMGRPHLDTGSGRLLRNISSLAFGGADLRTAYLGCLLGEQLASFRAPVAGYAPTHWNF